ncbi:putative exonuclease [Thermoanaerobacter kivui]|uniref:Putative exonuclease n=1 Tax=Thermoanaerobacter kivui TaxID=2325 RepID=A0A097AT11_THEKI|nr:MBL fold metallo-hydrolase [Thermoanaerobacter kivui]AIS52975.1 putative exonuclease [Thermoanaerobacter kivui]
MYLGIIEEAKEHFFDLYTDLEVDQHNLPLFIKNVLLLDMIERSLEVKGLFDALMNFNGEDPWIKFYLLSLSFKNKRRTFEILEELLYMEKEIEDNFLLAKIHGLIAEIYKKEGELKWREELDEAYKLNPLDLYVFRLKLEYGLISECELQNAKFYRLFPEKFNLVNVYYKKSKVSANNIRGFKFFCWGGGNVGASSYLVSYEGVNILLDAGALIKDKTLYYNSIENLPISVKEIDLVIITHSHLDHSGGIVELLKKGLNCPIIMSKPIEQILKEIFFRGYKKPDLEITEENLDDKENIVHFVNEEESFFIIKGKRIKVKLIPAGHMLGAMAVYIDIEGVKVFYTGDFTLKDVETNRGLKLPKDLKVDILITEATYGYSNNFGIQNKYLQDRLLLLSIKQLIDEEEKVLLPVYAIGKGQDLLMLLRKNFFYIPFNVYVDGDVAHFSKLYEAFVGNLYSNGVLNVADNTLYATRKEFIKKEVALGNCLVIASSNDLKEGSTSFLYATEMQNFDKGCILNLDFNNREFTGLKNYHIGVLNHGNMIDILEIVIKLAPSAVFVVHRGYRGKGQMNIEKILNGIEGLKVYVPQDGETVSL